MKSYSLAAWITQIFQVECLQRAVSGTREATGIWSRLTKGKAIGLQNLGHARPQLYAHILPHFLPAHQILFFRFSSSLIFLLLQLCFSFKTWICWLFLLLTCQTYGWAFRFATRHWSSTPNVCVHHISPSSFTLSCKILSFFIKRPFPQYGQRCPKFIEKAKENLLTGAEIKNVKIVFLDNQPISTRKSATFSCLAPSQAWLDSVPHIFEDHNTIPTNIACLLFASLGSFDIQSSL